MQELAVVVACVSVTVAAVCATLIVVFSTRARRRRRRFPRDPLEFLNYPRR